MFDRTKHSSRVRLDGEGQRMNFSPTLRRGQTLVTLPYRVRT